VGLKMAGHVDQSGLHDLSCSTKCGVTPSLVPTQ
jgi:hypothetical protein